MPQLLIKKIVGAKKHVKTQKGNEWDEWQVFGSVDGGEDDVYIVSFDPAGKENTKVTGYIQDRGQWGKKFNLPRGGGGGGWGGDKNGASIEAQKAVAEAIHLIVGNEELSKKYIFAGDLKKTAASVYILAGYLYKSIQEIKKSAVAAPAKPKQPAETEEQPQLPTDESTPQEDQSDQPDVGRDNVNLDDIPF